MKFLMNWSCNFYRNDVVMILAAKDLGDKNPRSFVIYELEM